MPEARNCQSCQAAFIANRSDTKFCSTQCRKRNARRVGKRSAEGNGGTVEAATLAELDRLGRYDSALGRLALELAASIDLRADPLSARATAAKELRATLDALGRGAKVAADPVDELAERRKSRLAGA